MQCYSSAVLKIEQSRVPGKDRVQWIVRGQGGEEPKLTRPSLFQFLCTLGTQLKPSWAPPLFSALPFPSCLAHGCPKQKCGPLPPLPTNSQQYTSHAWVHKRLEPQQSSQTYRFPAGEKHGLKNPITDCALLPLSGAPGTLAVRQTWSSAR